MASRRVQKVAEAIREVVSMAILTDIKDPRVRDVTVTRVEVAPDLRQAKVHVSVMGDETKARLCLAGLNRAAGFLQSKLPKRIETRYTPRLEFVIDVGVKKSLEIARILKEVLPADVEDDAVEEDAMEDVGEFDPAAEPQSSVQPQSQSQHLDDGGGQSQTPPPEP